MAKIELMSIDGSAADYNDLLEVEEVFLTCVRDEEIASLYKAGRAGVGTAVPALLDIAKGGWDTRAPTVREVKADRAMEILSWFRSLSH